MKFYEFNKFAYYALIGANSKEEAKDCYKEEVADIEEDDGEPDEITEEEAKNKLFKICKNNREKASAFKEFNYYSKDIEHPYLVLIDPDLC